MRGRGRGQTRAGVKTREAVGRLSGSRGGSRASRVCLQHCIWALRHASARARQGPDLAVD